KVIQRCSAIPPNPRENDLLDSYDNLLCRLFPVTSKFTVAPQSCFFSHSYGSTNLVVEFQVLFEHNLVFFLQIIQKNRKAQRTIKCERAWVIRPLTTLHDVSTFGTSLLLQLRSKSRILSRHVSPDRGLETDIAPLSRWDCDILQEEECQRFRDILAEMKTKCKRL
ncbi:hypothetical protein EDD18DRAFT_1078171, partial [Armillaria luteobubalina]